MIRATTLLLLLCGFSASTFAADAIAQPAPDGVLHRPHPDDKSGQRTLRHKKFAHLATPKATAVPPRPLPVELKPAGQPAPLSNLTITPGLMVTIDSGVGRH